MVALMLALGLLLGAAPGTASAEIVRSVRIEAPRPERFARYLDQLRPGEPVEPPGVRHAVELLYATGEFEDVVVEVERQEGGLDVVFRPRPAPRLNDIRVEGDRLMQPREVRRIARLRRGEPLWPLRLERAGRDVALAQVAKGYLEVQVAAEAAPAADPFAGADAIFRVRVGPRVRVGAAVIQPAAGGEATLLKDLVRPRAGEFYRKQEAERAAQAMRKRLVAAGRWRAEVKLEESYDPSAARMNLVFDVSAGPWTRVELRGAGVPAGLRTAVESLVKAGAFDPLGARRSQVFQVIDRAMQSGASAARDSSQLPISTAGPQSRTRSTVACGSAPYATRSPVQIAREGGIPRRRAAAISARVASRLP